VAPEKLRRARIFLLKVTHIPLVAAIWTYEGLSEYFRESPKLTGSTGVSTLGGPADEQANTFKRASLLRSFTPRTLIGTTVSQGSLQQVHRENRAKRSSRPGTAATGNEAQDDLKLLVLKLSAQLEDLKTIVAEQRTSKGQDE
jgi:hypothetical protein